METIENEIKALAENAKATHENLMHQFEEHKKVTEQALKEIDVKGTVDPLLKDMQDRISADMLKHQEAMDAISVKMNRPQFGIDSYDDADKKNQEALMFFKKVKRSRAEGGAVFIGSDRVIENGRPDLALFDAYKDAFNAHMRVTDVRQLTPEQAKALSIGSDPDGGYTVTPEMSNRIVERQFEMSPMRQVVTVENINSSSYAILDDPEEYSAARTSEGNTNGTSNTGQIGRREIVAHMLEARPKATQEMVEDSMWDIESYIANKIAKKFARVEADEFINGDGVGHARGITTYTSGTTWGSTIEQITSGANGSATYAQLATIATSLKEGYYANAQWLLHRTLIGKILGLSGNDTPLWIPSISVGQPSTLLGYPVRFAQDFATPATNSLSGAFGDFRAAYTWVDRRGITVRPDPYTQKPYIEYYATARSGGDVTDTDALKIIKLAA